MPDERDEVVQKLVAEWVPRVHADMTVATFVDDDRLAPEIIAFHAQQAAEKMLKALLVQRPLTFHALMQSVHCWRCVKKLALRALRNSPRQAA